MTNAWYTPSFFSPILFERPSSTTEIDASDNEFNEEGEDEILVSVEYVCKLIDGEIEKRVKPERIVWGGGG